MKRILIIKLGAVGDVVHALPVLETLRAAQPDAHLGWVVEGAAAPILQGNPALSELILLERRKLRGPAGISYFKTWLSDLKARGYDTVIDPHTLFKSGLIAWGSGAGLRIGFRKIREGNFLFMNRRVAPDPEYRHAVEKYLCLLKPLGIPAARWVVRFPLNWTPQDGEKIGTFWREEALEGNDPVVAINPGANWESKRWPPDRFARVADRLARRDRARIVLLWGPGERDLAERIAGEMSEKSRLAPETGLKSLAALLKRCRLMISGDSGPLHMAAAVGTPTVALFGPSHAERNGPYGKGHVVVRSTVPPATHWQRKEFGAHWMEAISVEAVVEAAERQLGREVIR